MAVYKVKTLENITKFKNTDGNEVWLSYEDRGAVCSEQNLWKITSNMRVLWSTPRPVLYVYSETPPVHLREEVSVLNQALAANSPSALEI